MGISLFGVMFDTASEAGAGTNFTVVAALISGTVGLAVALATIINSRLGEDRRLKNELQKMQEEASSRLQADRQEKLRVVASAFSAIAVEEVDIASALLRDPEKSGLRNDLENMHSKLRIEFEKLLLLSESIATQEAARMVVRVAYSERQQGLGQPRNRERLPEFADSGAKNMRSYLREFIRHTRTELGLSNEILDEPLD